MRMTCPTVAQAARFLTPVQVGLLRGPCHRGADLADPQAGHTTLAEIAVAPIMHTGRAASADGCAAQSCIHSKRERGGMGYIEGFVIAVPTANRQQFIRHATLGDAVFREHGAIRIVECWQEDVVKGHTTDFFGAVDAKEDESIVFSWIEWPDKTRREAMVSRMAEIMKSDDRLDPQKNPMPFDGARMIHGGFTPIVEQGTGSPGSYVQGFIVPVPNDKREAYRKMAEDVWTLFKDYGALRLVEAWDDHVPAGKVTDFRRAVKAGADEKIVFSFIEWPSRTVCDAAHAKMAEDDRMKMTPGQEMPFDGKRLVHGGFTPVVDLGGK